ncbi:MAG: AMP-binding protein [Pseudonocardiaceae bacterium]|nr:AMP-binding protein [Pseudonocardiaceae bacterium]
MGTFFEERAEAGARTVTHLSRPFDIAPQDGTTYDVEQLASLVRGAAGWLAAAGVGPGDRVAIAKDNHWDIDLLACAAIRVGALPSLIPNHLPAETQQLMLERLTPSLLVTTAGTLDAAWSTHTDLTALAERILTIDGTARGALSLDSVRGHEPPPPHRRHEDEPLIVVPTSGTTGVPKLVLHSTNTIIRRLASFEAHRWPVIVAKPDDTVATASSFTHGRTFCWTAVTYSLAPQSVVVVADHDVDTAEELFRAHPPTVLEGLPATYIQWLPMSARDDNPFTDVRLYVGTYDAVHPTTVRTYLGASTRWGALWAQGWGQTELGPLTFRFFTRRSVAKTAERHPTTRNQGRPIPLKTRLRVVDPETFAPVRPSTPGLIMAKTAACCLGYIGEQHRWEEKADGSWFNTGDIGTRTWLGNVVFVDREVDHIPAMSCVELEDVIDDRILQVLECVVLGTPGRRPLPVVVTGDGSLDKTAWEAAVRDLPELDEPLVFTWDQVPRTGTGKVRRLKLRECLADLSATYGTGRWT